MCSMQQSPCLKRPVRCSKSALLFDDIKINSNDDISTIAFLLINLAMEERVESSAKRQKIDIHGVDATELLLPYIKEGGVIKIDYTPIPNNYRIGRIGYFEHVPLLHCRLVCKHWYAETRTRFLECLGAILNWKTDFVFFWYNDQSTVSMGHEPFSKALNKILDIAREVDVTGMKMTGLSIVSRLAILPVVLFKHKENLSWIVTTPEFKQKPLVLRARFVSQMLNTASGRQRYESNPRTLLTGGARKILESARLPVVSSFSEEELRTAFIRIVGDPVAWIFYYFYFRDHPNFWSWQNFQADILVNAKFDSFEDFRPILLGKFYKKTSDKSRFLAEMRRVCEQHPIMHQEFLREIEILERPLDLPAQLPLQLLTPAQVDMARARSWFESLYKTNGAGETEN